jgi:hypothetical protein
VFCLVSIDASRNASPSKFDCELYPISQGSKDARNNMADDNEATTSATPAAETEKEPQVDVVEGEKTEGAGEAAAPGEPAKQEEGKVEGDASTFLAQGVKALALKRYGDATDALAQAVQLLTEKHGELAVEAAEAMILYGRALLQNAVANSAVLGRAPAEAQPDQGLSFLPLLHRRVLTESDNDSGTIHEHGGTRHGSKHFFPLWWR